MSEVLIKLEARCRIGSVSAYGTHAVQIYGGSLVLTKDHKYVGAQEIYSMIGGQALLVLHVCYFHRQAVTLAQVA
jgi:hypothetical protein